MVKEIVNERVNLIMPGLGFHSIYNFGCFVHKGLIFVHNILGAKTYAPKLQRFKGRQVTCITLISHAETRTVINSHHALRLSHAPSLREESIGCQKNTFQSGADNRGQGRKGECTIHNSNRLPAWPLPAFCLKILG